MELITILFALPTLATVTKSTELYYTYNNDCPHKCISKQITCLITETENNFVKICISSEGACRQEATDITVCLSPNNSPIGGEKSWPDYKHKYYPTPTTKAPKPQIPDAKLHVLIALSSAVTLLVLIVIIATIRYQCKRITTNQHESEPLLDDSRHTIPNPYMTTTVPLTNDADSHHE